MRSLSKRSRRSSFPASAVEALEGRRLLSGNVSVSTGPGGEQNIIGDNKSNHIVIKNIGFSLFITGEDGTALNGGTAPVPFDGFNSRTIDMGNGDDVVEFKLSPPVLGVVLGGTLAINTGNGADRVSMSAFNVPAGASIDTGNGDDEVTVDQFGVGALGGLGNMSIDTGNGDDEVYISHSHFNVLSVSLGRGNDELGFNLVAQSNSANSAVLDGGKGDDVLEHPGDLLVPGPGATVTGFETIVP